MTKIYNFGSVFSTLKFFFDNNKKTLFFPFFYHLQSVQTSFPVVYTLFFFPIQKSFFGLKDTWLTLLFKFLSFSYFYSSFPLFKKFSTKPPLLKIFWYYGFILFALFFFNSKNINHFSYYFPLYKKTLFYHYFRPLLKIFYLKTYFFAQILAYFLFLFLYGFLNYFSFIFVLLRLVRLFFLFFSFIFHFFFYTILTNFFAFLIKVFNYSNIFMLKSVLDRLIFKLKYGYSKYSFTRLFFFFIPFSFWSNVFSKIYTKLFSFFSIKLNLVQIRSSKFFVLVFTCIFNPFFHFNFFFMNFNFPIINAVLAKSNKKKFSLYYTYYLKYFYMSNI